MITLGSNEKGSEHDLDVNVINLESNVKVPHVIEDYGVDVVDDNVDEGMESNKGGDESSESKYPNSENCNCSLCTPHSGEVSESDGTDVDECNCERFGNCILSGELSRVSQQ